MTHYLPRLESEHTTDASQSAAQPTSFSDEIWNGASSAWKAATDSFSYGADAVASLILPKYDMGAQGIIPALPGPFDPHPPVEAYTPPPADAAKVEEPAPPKHHYEEPKIYNLCTNNPMLKYEMPGVCF